MINMALEEEEECLETQMQPQQMILEGTQEEEDAILAPPSPNLPEEDHVFLQNRDLPLEELYQQLQQQVIGKYQMLDKVGCLLELQRMHDKWGTSPSPNHTVSYGRLHDMALRNFGVPSEEDLLGGTEFVLKDIFLNIHREEWEIASLFLGLRRHNVFYSSQQQMALTQDEEDALVHGGFTLPLQPSTLLKMTSDIKNLIHGLRKVMGIYVYFTLEANKPFHPATIHNEEIDSEFNKFCQKLGVLGDEKTEKPCVTLLQYLKDCAAEKFIARIEEDQEVNVYVPIVERGRMNMYAYEYYSSVEEWVMEMVSDDYDYEMWKLFVSNNGHRKLCFDEMKTGKSVRTPWLVRNRSLFSFANGLYDAENMNFHRFNPETGMLQGDTSTLKGIAAKHFKGVNFDPYEEILDWRYVF